MSNTAQNAGNIFSGDRKGNPVVRPDDLVVMRIELMNITPQISKDGGRPILCKIREPASIILHFPPQSFAEQAFFESSTTFANETTPGYLNSSFTNTANTGNSVNPQPPVKARIAGESRIVFTIPQDINFEIEYSLEAVLAKCMELSQNNSNTTADPDIYNNNVLKRTAIELPWRLILSPDGSTRWQHSATPVVSNETSCIELWHSRLVAPQNNGAEIESPYPDKNRITRAIWAKTGKVGEGAGSISNPNVPVNMQSGWPTLNNLPKHEEKPFLTTLDDCDRYQIVHLSSNTSNQAYTPQPLETNTLMLSALGGWLDLRGAWDPSGGLSLEEWAHRTTMGRDNYVRVVYRGFLFPFGHRVSLVKISERKFYNRPNDNTAYLRQRQFIVIREKERIFDCNVFLNNNKEDPKKFARKFPFLSVKLLTEATPDILQPSLSQVNSYGQSMFWPSTGDNSNPKLFRFKCVAIDLDGQRVLFEMPMIYVDNTLASPHRKQVSNGVISYIPDFSEAASKANDAIGAFITKSESGKKCCQVELDWQQVALAPSSPQSGDTSVPVKQMEIGGYSNIALSDYSKNLTLPMWFPQVAWITARVKSLSYLSNNQNPHRLEYNSAYLQYGFPDKNTYNKGEVFLDITSGPDLDFSSQGDKSGGFLQPNLRPKALSRLVGPVMSDVNSFVQGIVPDGAGFPTPNPAYSIPAMPGLPWPYLFGCIPLGEILMGSSAGIAQSKGSVPTLMSKASTQVESFISDLYKLYGLVGDIPAQPVRVAQGAMEVFRETLNDLVLQAAAYPALASSSQIKQKISELSAKLQNIADALTAYIQSTPANMATRWAVVVSSIDAALNSASAIKQIINQIYNGMSFPAGFKQSVLNAISKITALLRQLEQLETLSICSKDLYAALADIVGPNKNVVDLFTNPSQLKTLLTSLKGKISPFRQALLNAELLDGAPRNALCAVLKSVEDIFKNAADLLKLVEMLTGDELKISLDWNPTIKSWGLKQGSYLFRANDKKGLVVAVEASVKKNNMSSAKVSAYCSLKHFDLVLIAPASFIELNFEKIEFSVNSAAKMDVDVVLSDIKFVGVLSFVETLRDLIPLNGFSDPPYLDISPKGVDAGYSISLPTIACGILNISNLSLGAGFTVPFIGQPLSVRFNFCSREKPFMLTVSMFGGGGFFGITISPNGVQILEAALEFGASISINLGVASGGVYVMAGIYFRMEQQSEASLTGYFRLGGSVSVIKLITASIELYLALSYDFHTGKCVGEASLTIAVSVLFFSTRVTIRCRRTFAGSNGDPTLRQLLGYLPDIPIERELDLIKEDTQYAWREYLEAFSI